MAKTEDAHEPAVAGVLPSPEALARFGALIGRAVKEGATAIHVGPAFDEATQRSVPRVEFRVGGAMREVERISVEECDELLSRAKQLSDLDLTGRGLPQEGRMMLSLGGKSIDLLVSATPTALGERLCLRVFDAAKGRPEIGALGLPKVALVTLRRWAALPRGLVLLCGPAVATDRALYYALLAEARSRGRVASVEEPVDKVLSGVDPIQVDRPVGLTPARAIRASMRLDVDVLGVAELRGPEEADLAVDAALAGHLVVVQVSAVGASAGLARLAEWVFNRNALSRALAGVLAWSRGDSSCEVASTPAKLRSLVSVARRRHAHGGAR